MKKGSLSPISSRSASGNGSGSGKDPDSEKGGGYTLSLDGSALAQDHHNRIARCELHDGENDEYDAYDYGDHHQ